jgi:two-component system chemotaxis response regulator CheB
VKGHDIIVIGGSAGGVEPLLSITRQLPAEIPAAIFVVIHLSPFVPSHLPAVLSRAGALQAVHATDGQEIVPGHIYIAPQDRHLLVRKGIMRVVRGPKENHCRPAIDPLFRTAAVTYGPRVIGVILSGALDDGTAGLLAVKRQGGMAIIQDPADALMPMMPRSALRYVQADYTVPGAEIAPLLAQIAASPVNEKTSYPVPNEMSYEASIVEAEQARVEKVSPPGMPANLVCPECHGPLWEIEENGLIRYRCREGHAYTGEGVLDGQAVGVEQALWLALETLTESVIVANKLAERARRNGLESAAKSFIARARESEEQAALLRRVLNTTPVTRPAEEEGDQQPDEEPPAEMAGD